MSAEKSLIGNTFVYAFSSITPLFLFLLLILAGRHLGAEDFGIFSFALAFVFLFDPLLDPGLYHLMIREIAKNKIHATRYLSHALAWKALISPVFFIAIIVGVNAMHDSDKTLHAVYLLGVSCILKSSKDAFRATLLAHERFAWDTISLALERLLLLLVGTLVLLAGKGLLGLCWVFVLVRAIDLLVIGAMVRLGICRIQFRIERGFLRQLIVNAVPIGAFYITLNLYNYIDTVMISIFRTNSEVGWYNAAYKLYEGLAVIPVIISTVFLPRLSQLHTKKGEDFDALLLKGVKYLVALGVLVSTNGFVFARPFMSISFGAGYTESVPALNILLLGTVFLFTISFFQSVMIAMDHQRVMLFVALFGLCMNIGLNLMLIPAFGYLGAAVATITIEGLVLCIFLWHIKKVRKGIQWLGLFTKPVAAISIAASVAFWFLPTDSVAIKVCALNVGFIFLLYGLRFFDKEEVAAFRDFLLMRK